MQRLNWNDLQDFLNIARTGRLVRASSLSGVDATTLGRRLRRLEHRLGQTLFEQSSEGLIPTAAGERLLINAEAMQAAAERIDDAASDDARLSGLLRISVSEGFGTWYVAHRLRDFTDVHPELKVDLVASSGFRSPSKRETDVAIMLGQPTAGSLISRKLTDYDLCLYGGKRYLERCGEPAMVTDLAEHHALVGYVPELLYAPQLDYLGDVAEGLDARIRSTSINAQYRAIAAGAGIGVLPYFIGRADPQLARVLPACRIRRSFWMVTHPDTRDLKRTRVFQRWLLTSVTSDRAMFVSSPPPLKASKV